MDTTRIAGLALLAVLVISAGAMLVAANDTARGEPEIDAFAPETAFVPGEEATLEITLNNRGNVREQGFDNLEDEVVTARSATARIDDEGIPFDVRTGEQPIGDVPEGPLGPIEFTVVPDEDAEPGVYEVPITLEYRHTYRAEQDDGATIRSERDVTETVTVEVEITDRARFAVVDVDSDVQAGTNGIANVTLRNVGDDPARNVSLSMTPIDPDLSYVTGAGTTDTFIERWEPGENRTFTYALTADEDATVRPSTIEFETEYWDNESADAEARTIRTGITPVPAQSFSAQGVESDLHVGEDGTFVATVTNEGPRNVSDVVVVFDNEAPAIDAFGGETVPADDNVVPRDTQVSVGDLAAGENATVEFEAGIRTDARPGPRTLSVVTRYRDDAGEIAVSDALDVVVDVGPERDPFAVEAVEPTAEQGSTVTYEVRVENTRDEPVSDIEAKLFTSDPIDSDDDEAFLTELGPGETATLQFTIDVDDGAATKAYAVSVDFRYDDAEGDSQLTDAYRLPVQVVEPPNGAQPTWLLGGAVVLLVALAALGYWKRELVRARLRGLTG